MRSLWRHFARRLGGMRIEKQILLAMVLISVCSSLILGTVVYSFSKYIIEKNYKQTYTDNLEISGNITDMQMDAFVELMRTPLQNDTLMKILAESKQTSTGKMFSSVDNLALGKILGEIAGLNDKIEGLSLISMGGKAKFYYKRVKSGSFDRYYGTENILESEWIEAADEAAGKEIFYSGDVVIGDSSPYISVAKKLIHPGDGEPMGYLVASVRKTIFDKAFNIAQNSGRANSYIVFDRAAPEPVAYYNGSAEEKSAMVEAYLNQTGKQDDYVFSRSVNKTTGWEMVNVIAKNDLTLDSRYIGGIIVAAILFLVCISVWLANLIAARIYSPLGKLESVIEKVGEGERHISEDFDSTEVGLIGQKFKKMVNTNLELSDKLFSAEIKEREAELLLLQSQINPHFLYNTLDSLYCMAIIDGNEKIAEMVSALSNIFKLSLNKGSKYVKIEDELSHIEQYMFIQNIRYNNRFTLEMQVDEAVKRQYMIKFILQPFVENAVYHGLEPKIGKGSVRVTGQLDEEGNLRFAIEDDGIGMADLRAVEKGYGVRNVRDRIELFYGTAYGITYESTPGKGTRVEIRIPLLNKTNAKSKLLQNEAIHGKEDSAHEETGGN